MNDIPYSFVPVASTYASHNRTRIEPGEYRATCTAVKPPELYRAFARWYMRVDFAIHDIGIVVSKYINLGAGKEPKFQLGPRTDYYKLWALAVGRSPNENEPMPPSEIVGIEFLVMVADREREDGGEVYSRVESVRRELEAHEALLLCDSSSHGLNTSAAQLLNGSASQDCSSTQVHSSSPEQFSEFPMDEIPIRGPQRFAVFQDLRARDPEKGQRFLQACRLKDTQAA